MQPYQERIIEERDQLKGRLNRLQEFIKSPSYHHDINGAERDRLLTQRYHMHSYLKVLQARIAAFEEV